MADFGDILTSGRMATYQEDPAGSLGRTGGAPPGEVAIGALDTPAIQLTAPAQFISGRVVAPVDWDTSVNSLGVVAFALDGPQANLDTITFDVEYQYLQAGTAALADMNKATTALAAVATLTTAEGLADETLYYLTAQLDRNDANNPYVGGLPGGGFAFQLSLDAASSIASVHIISVGISFPLQGLDLGPIATS